MNLKPAFLSIVLLPGMAVAQAPPSRASMPPVKIQPPARIAWVVDFKADEKKPAPEAAAGAELAESGNAPDAVVEARYELNGAAGHAVLERADGSKEEMYLSDGMVLFEDKALKTVRVHKIDQYSGDEMRFGQFFPGVNWVQPSWFRGVVERNGVRCYWFRQEKGTGENAVRPTDPLVYDNRHATEAREAWFDAVTLLPVAFRDGAMEGRYRYLPEPGKSLELPRRHQHAIRYYMGLESSPVPRE